MIWALRLLGIGGKLMAWGRSAFEWLTGAWYRIVIAMLLGACIWLYVGKSSALASAAKWKRTAEVEMALRISNEVTYKNAQEVAADLNRKQVAAIKERYDAIAEKSEIDYEKRLASNKLALNDWMRRQAQATGRSGEGIGAGSATEVQTDSTGTEAVPVIPRGFVIVPESDLDKTAVIQATLAALQEAARAIEATKPNE